MTEPLFVEKYRTDATPMHYTEDPFVFYDRCDGPAFENVRLLLNCWLEAYPESERQELSRRFRSEFYAAFYELALYTIFAALGCSLEPHPILSHSTKRCDFRVSGAAEFFLECINTNGLSAKEENRQNTVHYFYDVLNQMDCPSFYLKLVEVHFKGSSYPPLTKIRAQLEIEINQIDPDTMPAGTIREFRDLPGLSYEDPKFRLVLQLIPKPPQTREKKARAIGVTTTGFHIGGFGHVIADALRRKAAKYGKITAPFLIAINALTALPVDEYDIEDALFGNVYRNYIPAILNGERAIPAAAESSFFWKGKAIHTRVSAVLVSNLTPTNLVWAKYWIYFHPLAEYPLYLKALGLHANRIGPDGIAVTEGRRIAEILGLPADWPGEKKDWRPQSH
ncbi:hypothetical protein AY601_1786 [Pedobacter cryoconitis]|uniref:Uncharacterized protein n=1 Tax=Pedobacter cryoconitis TaxID=188932 RepID=A0A127VBU0_9SPHI|nr:hypothetical protein [Pedobacter cryoconitis]AMP98697.1 hypothetical protein AY601_1786 [Pedobacter cryoconitis]